MSGIILLLLAAEVIPWTWEWALLGVGGPESVSSFAREFLFKTNLVNRRKAKEREREKRRLKQVESAQNATTETPTLPYL